MPTLVAQEGHVPRTTGSTGTAGEQRMAIAVAAQLRVQRPDGWNLRVIEADVDGALYKGDAFVAIHGDGNSNPTAKGASVGYRTGGAALAADWKAAYKAQGFPGAWKADNYTEDLHGYYGVRIATSVGNPRAIVIEVGMMTNAAERKWIDANAAAIARSIWAAVAGQEEVMLPLDYRYMTIVDLGDPKHREALRESAKALGLSTTEGATSFSVDAAKGMKADIFIDYATRNGLDCPSVNTYRGQASTMQLRMKGLPAPIDAVCATENSLLKSNISAAIVELNRKERS